MWRELLSVRVRLREDADEEDEDAEGRSLSLLLSSSSSSTLGGALDREMKAWGMMGRAVEEPDGR